MRIDILSDLHLDFWFRADKPFPNDTRIRNIFDGILNKNIYHEVLIIAGDISHYNSQISIVEKIAELYEYKKIFMVIGNHDIWLIGNKNKYKYKTSNNRKKEWYNYKDLKNIIHILNGDVVEYKGIKFGGFMGWYDASFKGYKDNYMIPSNNIHLWKSVSNDPVYIKGYEDYMEIFNEEMKIIDKMPTDIDIMISHFVPINEPIAFTDAYKTDETNKFYCFNGIDYVEKLKPKYWIYGHSHNYHSFDIYNTKFIMNALGYPSEYHNIMNKFIELGD